MSTSQLNHLLWVTDLIQTRGQLTVYSCSQQPVVMTRTLQMQVGFPSRQIAGDDEWGRVLVTTHYKKTGYMNYITAFNFGISAHY